MVLGEVEETVTYYVIDDETYEEILKVKEEERKNFKTVFHDRSFFFQRSLKTNFWFCCLLSLTSS